MRQLLVLNPENATPQEIDNFQVRDAARAVVFDKENNVALLHVTRKNYYKLPGGGVEKGEDLLTALRRECKEEIGCTIEVQAEIGTVVEYRKMFRIKQISNCYVASVIGEKGEPSFVGEEITDNFKIVWLPMPDALGLLKGCQAADLEGRAYIVPRDIAILEVAVQ